MGGLKPPQPLPLRGPWAGQWTMSSQKLGIDWFNPWRDLSHITLQWANIKKQGQGSDGHFHTNHCIVSIRASSWCLFYSNAGKVYCQTCLVMALLEKICQLNLVHNHLVAVPDREQKGYTYYIIYFKLWILLCCIISLANDSVGFSLFP